MPVRHVVAGRVAHVQWQRSQLMVWLARVLWLLAGVSLLAWCLAPAEEPQAGVRWLGALAACVCLLWAWRLPFEAAPRMGFDPLDGWSLDDEPATGAVDLAVCLDLGSAMLIRYRPVATAGQRPGTRWLALDQRAHPQEWSELRRAVYSARIQPASAKPATHGAPPRSPDPHE